MKHTKAEKDIQDLYFIITELARFSSMNVQEIMAYVREHKNDAFFTIPSPKSNGGHLIIGQAAGQRLFDLAARHLATRPDLENDFDIDHFIEALKEEFVWRFIKKRETELSQRTLDKLLSAAVKRAKKEHKSLTHFIPCVLVSSKEPDEFKVGPVTFRRMEKFLLEHKAEFDTSRAEIRAEHIKRCEAAIANGRDPETIATPDQSEAIANRLIDETTEYFEQFNWLAIVSIPTCNIKVSRKRAERAVEAALDVLKLFFARLHGKALRQGHSMGLPRKTAKLTRELNGVLDFSYGYNTQDTPAGKDWMRVLTSPNDFHFRAAASAVHVCCEPEKMSPLVQRFLDALAWYGQGVSEPETSVQIVKYVAALERLTITKKIESGLTDAVVRRTALLTCDETKDGYETARDDADRVYEWRSRLMHGSVSPFDRELEFIAPVAERLTRVALFGSLVLFTHLVNSISNANAKHLEAEYLHWEQDIEQHRSTDESTL